MIDFSKEIPEVDNTDVAFGVSTLDKFPTYEEIPDEFQNGHTKWNKLFNDWFFSGLKSLELTPKNGIDKEKAQRYIRAHMKTFKSGHEHKESGLAYVMSLWFDDVTWEKSADKR